MSKFILLYHKELSYDTKLIKGRLLLVDTQRATIADTYVATSGLPTKQSFDDQDLRGNGTIPRCDLVNIPHYLVLTNPIFMLQVKGVEGNFYKINPHEVFLDGTKRGDFGIHRDAGVPGSAGCIVLPTPSGWNGFEKRMKELRQSGVKQIPLMVSYVR